MQPGCLIHLDNNYLTNLLDGVSIEYQDVAKWIANEHPIGTSAIAWTEFMRGTTTNGRNKAEINAAKTLLTNNITPFGEEEAERAAYLFNRIQRPIGKKAKLRMDCLIAACAITQNARLATNNRPDFEHFQRYQLEFVEIEL